MFQTVDRVLSLIERIVHDVLDIIRAQFELLFIAMLYLSVAWILAVMQHNESLDYWLTGGAMVGAIATLVNRFGATRYKNGGPNPPENPPTNPPAAPKE